MCVCVFLFVLFCKCLPVILFCLLSLLPCFVTFMKMPDIFWVLFSPLMVYRFLEIKKKKLFASAVPSLADG